jgi:hypothetical protein
MTNALNTSGGGLFTAGLKSAYKDVIIGFYALIPLY